MASIVSHAGHGLVAGDTFYFGNLIPSDCGITEGRTYYVLAAGLTADAFTFSETAAGTPFVLTHDVTSGIISKTAVYTPITDPTHVMAPPTIPDAPTSFNLSSAIELDADGHAITRLYISLVQPTIATLRHSVVIITPAAGDPIRVVIPAGQTTASVRGVKAGILYTGHANAWDVFGNESVSSNTDTETPPGDTTAPAQITGAAAFGAILGLIATWTVATETDFSHYQVQVDTVNTFGSATTYSQKSNVISLQQIAVGTYYFRIRAVDLSGNAGAYSSTVSATSRVVQTADLADALITTAKLVAGAVTDVELASAAVTAAKIAVDAVTSSAIAAGAVQTAELDALAVTGAKIAAGAITAAKITAGTITSNEIAALTIVAANIAAGTITAAKIAAGTITATEIAALTIVAANIAAGTITAAKIAAGTITANEIAADTITASNIAASAITSSELAANAVIAGKIAAGTIATADLNATCSIKLVSNVGATVVIDSTGITITDGKLILKDYAGINVIGAAGFAGSWLDFLASGGIYNSTFAVASTSDIPVSEVGTGSTVADYAASVGQNLPYWVVSASGGVIKQVTDADGPNGKALEFSSTGAGQTSRIYQDIPVSTVLAGPAFEYFQSHNYVATGTDVRLYASWRDETHAIIGTRMELTGGGYDTTYTAWGTAGVMNLAILFSYDTLPAAFLAPTSPAAYLRLEYEVVHTTHAAGKYVRLSSVRINMVFTQNLVYASEGGFENLNATTLGGTTLHISGDATLDSALVVGGATALNADVTIPTGFLTNRGETVPPLGSILMYGGTAAPATYVLCDGTSYLRAGTYAGLFAVIGTTYGAADGTHFSVPDLRQRFPLGKAASGTGSTLGGTGGAIDHTHSVPAHNHTQSATHTHGVTLTVASLPGGAAITGAGANTGATGTGKIGVTSITAVGTTAPLTSTAVAPGTTDSVLAGTSGTANAPYVVVNYIIRAYA